MRHLIRRFFGTIGIKHSTVHQKNGVQDSVQNASGFLQRAIQNVLWAFVLLLSFGVLLTLFGLKELVESGNFFVGLLAVPAFLLYSVIFYKI